MKKRLLILAICLVCSTLLAPRAWSTTDKVQIRLYTDYLCKSCQELEAETSDLLAIISQKGLGTVQYIDTPTHVETIVYAHYFIYATEDRDKSTERAVRKVLYRAARERIRDDKTLSRYLQAQGIDVTKCEVKDRFRRYSDLIIADRITSTPTCVIESGSGKRVFKGIKEITAAVKKMAGDAQE